MQSITQSKGQVYDVEEEYKDGPNQSPGGASNIDQEEDEIKDKDEEK